MNNYKCHEGYERPLKFDRDSLVYCESQGAAQVSGVGATLLPGPIQMIAQLRPRVVCQRAA